MSGTRSYAAVPATTMMMVAVCRNVGSLLPCSSPRVMWDLFTSSLSLSFPKTATCVLILLPLDPLCLQKRSAFHWDPTWTNEGKGQPPTRKTVKQADKSALGDPLLNGKKVVISCLHKTMNHLWMDVAPWCFKWTGLGWKDRIWGPHWGR